MTAPTPIEFRGTWVKRGLIHVPTTPPAKKVGRPRKPELFTWNPTTIRAAHTAYVRGERDEWAREGERAYQRNRDRKQKKGAA